MSKTLNLVPGAVRGSDLPDWIATALRAHHREPTPDHDLEIAHHLVAAGPAADPNLLVAYARRAGDGAAVDEAFRIADAEAVTIAFDLLEHEGLCMGGSTGINVAGAIRLARQMGPGHTIVTVLCDYGTRYASKLFNPAFLREKNLPVPAWLERSSGLPGVFEETPA